MPLFLPLKSQGNFPISFKSNRCSSAVFVSVLQQQILVLMWDYYACYLRTWMSNASTWCHSKTNQVGHIRSIYKFVDDCVVAETLVFWSRWNVIILPETEIIRECVLHGMRSARNAFCTECVLHGMRSARNAFYTECVLHGMRSTRNAFCTECVLHGMRSTRSVFYTECVLHGMRSARNAFCTECVLHGMRSARNVFCTECVLHGMRSARNVFCTECVLHGHWSNTRIILF